MMLRTEIEFSFRTSWVAGADVMRHQAHLISHAMKSLSSSFDLYASRVCGDVRPVGIEIRYGMGDLAPATWKQ